MRNACTVPVVWRAADFCGRGAPARAFNCGNFYDGSPRKHTSEIQIDATSFLEIHLEMVDEGDTFLGRIHFRICCA